MGFGGVVKLNKRGYALIGLLMVIAVYFHFRNKSSRDNEEKVSLPYLLQTAIQAAEEGGKLVVSIRDNLIVHSKGKTKEGVDDSVTAADFLSHCAMERLITGRFQNIKFISEEKDTPCEDKSYEYSEKAVTSIPDVFVKASDVTVWIDPLDATHEYTEKLYQYVTTMVCVTVKGEPIIGVIHKPFTRSTSWAIVGYGHSDDLQEANKKDSTGGLKIIISRSHRGPIEEVLKKNFENYRVMIAAGAGYKALKVADGSADAYLHITAIKKWDICAGHAILNALGGKMTTKRGKPLTYFNDTDVVNSDGLIATLQKHELFVDKL